MAKLVLERLRSKYFGECISKPSSLYEIGSLVNVANRTWRGINKEGGVGRIVAINDTENTVDVKYVLTGTEKNIDLHYVEFHKFLQDDNDDKKDTTGRASRRITRRAKTVIDTKLEEKKKPLSGGKGVDSPVKKEEKSTSQQVNTVTPATLEMNNITKDSKKKRFKKKKSKKSKKHKSPRLSEDDLDRMTQATKTSPITPVVTPDKKEKTQPKKTFTISELKDSPVTVAASSDDTTLRKIKKVQKRKLPVETKELSRVINAEVVDTSPSFDGNITKRIPKKQKKIKPENQYNRQKMVNEKPALQLIDKVVPHRLNHNEASKVSILGGDKIKKKKLRLRIKKMNNSIEKIDSTQSKNGKNEEEEELPRFSAPMSVSSHSLVSNKLIQVHDIRWY